jgi:hypothetical protein
MCSAVVPRPDPQASAVMSAMSRSGRHVDRVEIAESASATSLPQTAPEIGLGFLLHLDARPPERWQTGQSLAQA